jgi:hypothetical protein
MPQQATARLITSQTTSIDAIDANAQLIFFFGGDRVAILGTDANAVPKNEIREDASLQMIRLVAGVGFEPTTFRL